MKSTIAVAIVSLAAMQRMKALTAESDIDNVLLEWTLICELVAIGDLEYCLPVMIGEVTEQTQDDGKFVTDLFETASGFKWTNDGISSFSFERSQ